MPRTTTDARDRILDTASKLFYLHGVRAIGVDTLIAQSEVAKTTFYRYFPAKDDLVVAYLEERDRLFWQLLEAVANQYPGQPQQQLLAILGWLDELLSNPENQGCPFLIVASEFPEPEYPGHRVAIAHKQKMCDRLTELTIGMGISSAQELSAELMLLVDGAFAQRRLYQAHRVSLKETGESLIRANL